MRVFDGLQHCVREKVPLAPFTSYRLGGPAEFYATPANEQDLSAVLQRARSEDVSVRIMGHGTNLLVGDGGVDGLVVRLPKEGFAGVALDEDAMLLRIGAGQSLPGAVNWTLFRDLEGLQYLAGVPGTVGAALRMNAGGRYGNIGSQVVSVEGLHLDGSAFHWSADECGFRYRDSGLRDHLVTRCELRVQPGERTDGVKNAFRQILDEKRSLQPLAARSAGCAFKNPAAPGVPPAGRLIEELGLKGLRVGKAAVSDRHANFLVCEAGGRAADVAELIRRIRAKAWSQRGVRLELEIEVWGVSAEDLWPAELRVDVA